MLSGHQRELKVWRYVRSWIEGLERAELERTAADDKKGKR